MKKCFYLTVVAVLTISTIVQAGYQSGSCTNGSFTVNFSGASFVTGLGWNPGTSRTISFAGSCSGCNLGPIVYGWGYGSTLVEYYIGRGGGTSAGSYSTSKGTYTLYTNSCNGPNITGTGPFTQYNAGGSNSSGQPMGEHFNGWSSLGRGLSSQNYQVVMVESWSSGTGSATVSVAGSNWFTNWWGSGSASFTCGGGGTLPSPASSPAPANGATNVGITTDISWAAGSGATSHDVYFGTTSPGTYRGNKTITTYETGTMAGNTTYYWRIDEKNATGTTTGNIWSFTTGPAEPQNCTDVQIAGYRLLSDLTGDCYVDELDMAILTNYWLYEDCANYGDCEGADFEPDSDVDFADFADFATLWLECNDPEDPGCLQNW